MEQRKVELMRPTKVKAMVFAADAEARLDQTSCKKISEALQKALKGIPWPIEALIVDLTGVTGADDTCYYGTIENALLRKVSEHISQPARISFVVGDNWSQGKGGVVISYYSSVDDAVADSLQWQVVRPAEKDEVCSHCGQALPKRQRSA